MQRTKSKLLSILLSLVMLLSLLPTTALAASPDASNVFVDGGKNFYNPGRLYYKNNDPANAFTGTSTDFNAAYDPATGTLTLKDYNGKGITVGGVECSDITVVLKGTNTINGSLTNDVGGDITITSESGGTLSITNTLSGGKAIGIETGLSASYTTGNVTIKGDAKVTINMTNNGMSTYEKAYGIYAKKNITISENASVDITCATPGNTTGGDNCNGLYAAQNVTIDTNGTIKIDVTKAGKDEGYSFGIYPMGTATLSKVGEMEVQWKSHATHSSFPGGAVYKKGASLSDTDYAINEDETNCYASYRKGTPYTVTVENGTLTGHGVKYANGSGNFLENDTVNITPDPKAGKSGEPIPFKEWTSLDVTLISSATTESNSFTVPGKNVTVTAMHSPFVGTPTFTPTGSTGTDGTLTFKTVVKPGDGNEYFNLVKAGDENDVAKYKSLAPNNSLSTSPYEYSYAATSGSSSSQVVAGDYYVAEKLNGAWYLSEKFTVSYAAAPTPTASVDDVSIDGVKDSSITAAEVKITLTNDTFESTLSGNWITNLPAGLSQSVSRTDDTHAKITVSGNPSVASSDALVIKIPAANLVSNADLTVTSNANAKYNITAPLTAIPVPTANTGLVYDGTEKTGVSGGTGYTLGGTYKATNVGTTADYAATATLETGYKWNDGSTDVKTINWNIGKRTPTVTDFTFAPPPDLTYDGNNKTASVTLKSPFTNSGAITVKYEKGSSVVTETKDVGDYTVKIDVAGGDNFNAGSNLNDPAWTFSITPANQSAPTGLGVAAPTASGGNGKITGTTTAMEYNTDATATSGWTTCSATETEVTPGTYYVRYKADANHNAGAVSAALVVPGYSATKYTVTVTYDANGTAIADKTTDVAAGETVTLTATPKSGYVFDEWVEKTPAGLTIGADGKFTMPSENVRVKATFKGAALTGTVNITGTLKYGQELTATLTGGNNTGNLDYKWYQNGTTQVAANNTGKYTLRADDIGKTITVKVSSSVQTGEISSAATAAVGKADGPAAPSAFTLTFTLNSDGTTFTATIPAFAGGEYSFDGATYSTTNTKTDCAANTSYTGYARVKETATHKTGTEISDTQTSPKLTVATPTFTPNGASGFSGTQSVTISCTTAGATIHYTTDSTEPTASSPVYSAALSLTSTTTVKAIAVKADMNNSAIATATFTKYSGGGGGGGGSYTPSYTVSVDKTENGTITVSPKSASKGDTVTITVKPDKGYELEMLKALDKDGDALKLTEKNGKYTFKMPSGKVTVKGSFVEEAPMQIFKDVPVDAYYYEAVKWAAEKGITGGVGNGLFAPNQPCTRAQIVTFLWRAAGSPAPKNMSSFADVPADAFYAKAVAWAVENGITGGTGDGKFSPDATCTRAQSVTFLYRAAGSPKVSGSAEFGDVATNAYYADAVAWAAKNGITGGIGGGLFGSGNDCTRAQIVTFLYRSMK